MAEQEFKEKASKNDMDYRRKLPIGRCVLGSLCCTLILIVIPYLIWANGRIEWLWASLISLLIFLLLILWKVPQWQVASLRESSSAERLVSLKNELRKTLAHIIGGIIIIAGLYGTWKTTEISREALEISKKMSIENLRMSAEGQITERFTRAVEHIGSEKLEIRLGGIYALERIAKDSLKDHWQVMEIITAYVRENSPWNPKLKPKHESSKIAKEKHTESSQPVETLKLSTEVQAILSVIGRRILAYNKGEEQPLDLSKSNLCMARIVGANLEGIKLNGSNLKNSNLTETNLKNAILEKANLEGADLKGVILEGANLKGVILEEANLKNAILEGANLESADLENAILEEADLKHCILYGANLIGATLESADLKGANLEEANVMRANLERANLEGARLVNNNLISCNLKETCLRKVIFWGSNMRGSNQWGADLTEANLVETNLMFVNLEGADLEKANLENANLKNAKLTGANLKKANLEGANLEGADLERANLAGATLTGVKNLAIDQLLQVNTLYNAKIDPDSMRLIEKYNPRLLVKP